MLTLADLSFSWFSKDIKILAWVSYLNTEHRAKQYMEKNTPYFIPVTFHNSECKQLRCDVIPVWPDYLSEKKSFGNPATMLFSPCQKCKKEETLLAKYLTLSHPWHGQSAKANGTGLEMRRGKILLEILQKGMFQRRAGKGKIYGSNFTDTNWEVFPSSSCQYLSWWHTCTHTNGGNTTIKIKIIQVDLSYWQIGVLCSSL